MRAMMATVIGMGVLIVLGVAVLGVTIVRRLSTSAAVVAVAVTVEEPPGTRMQGVASAGDRVAVLLQGGGPDRIVLLDPHSGQVVGRVGLAR